MGWALNVMLGWTQHFHCRFLGLKPDFGVEGGILDPPPALVF